MVGLNKIFDALIQNKKYLLNIYPHLPKHVRVQKVIKQYNVNKLQNKVKFRLR